MHKTQRRPNQVIHITLLTGLLMILAFGTSSNVYAHLDNLSGNAQESLFLLVNQPPSVSVGADQTITIVDHAFLRGVVGDDDLPLPGAILSATWSKISGPGTVEFGNKNDFLTWATFSATGTYVLRLTVNDGELTSTDDLNIVVNSTAPHTIRIPQDFPTIQAGINAAQDRDLILVSPGVYVENLSFGKTITLASTFYTTGDESLIDQTIISSPNILTPTMVLSSSTGPETRVIGFTITSGSDGLKVRGMVSALNNKFLNQDTDAVDISAGGAGLVMNNYFANNGDDGVDLNNSDALVESNQMVTNGEGIEIRASNHVGTQLTMIIRDNIIKDNRKTGLQLIDIDTVSNTAALLVIERNLIANHPQSGLSLMDNQITTDDYRAASLLERIHLFNNTFVGNLYGVHGGDNLIAVNNIFANHAAIAVKQIDGGSVLSHNLFWDNATDNLGSNHDAGTTQFADPLFDAQYGLQSGSPAIDAGAALFTLASGETVLNIPASDFYGVAPDFGTYESNLISTSTPTPGPSPTPTNTATPTNTSAPTSTPTPTSTPNPSNAGSYLSLSGNQTIGGIASADEDVLRFDGTSWSMFFDGSDVGVGSSDVSGVSIVDANTVLMSFSSAVTVNGLSIAPQDVVRFEAISLGPLTSGTFSMYLDGSDVGLDTTAEKLDAVSLLTDGRVLISTTGNPAVVGITGGRDEDVLAFSPTSLGDVTNGTWAMYFDGSDVALGETSGEDIDALDVAGGKVYLSTADIFSVNGIAGADEDVFVCVPTLLGDVTACDYSSALHFDGSIWGLSANDVDAFNVPAGGLEPTSTPTNTPTPTMTPTPTHTSTPGPQLLPDLTITDLRIELQDPNCLNPGDSLGVRVWITNIGQAAAGNFIVDVNGVEQTINGAGVGETNAVFFPTYSNPVTATVDSTNMVAESDESNNSRSEVLPVPTLPAPCATPTFTPTATDTPTPTATDTPGSSDLIFADSFEPGNLSAWSSSNTDLGDLAVSSAAALLGSQGLQAVIDDTSSIYLTSDSPNAEARYRARFYFDPNSISMANGDAHIIFTGLMSTSTAVLRMEFSQSSGSYQVRVRAILDGSTTWVNTSWYPISDAKHVIELDWRAATGAGLNNGGLTVWIDGIQQADLTGLDNDTWRIDSVRLGAVTGVDAGTLGTCFFDAFESRRQSYIGP